MRRVIHVPAARPVAVIVTLGMKLRSKVKWRKH
jgi:hypothetical protein